MSICTLHCEKVSSKRNTQSRMATTAQTAPHCITHSHIPNILHAHCALSSRKIIHFYITLQRSAMRVGRALEPAPAQFEWTIPYTCEGGTAAEVPAVPTVPTSTSWKLTQRSRASEEQLNHMILPILERNPRLAKAHEEYLLLRARNSATTTSGIVDHEPSEHASSYHDAALANTVRVFHTQHGMSAQRADFPSRLPVPAFEAVTPHLPTRPEQPSNVCELAADDFDEGHLRHVGRANDALRTLAPDSAARAVGFGVRLREVFRERFHADEPWMSRDERVHLDAIAGSCGVGNRSSGGGGGDDGSGGASSRAGGGVVSRAGGEDSSHAGGGFYSNSREGGSASSRGGDGGGVSSHGCRMARGAKKEMPWSLEEHSIWKVAAQTACILISSMIT